LALDSRPTLSQPGHIFVVVLAKLLKKYKEGVSASTSTQTVTALEIVMNICISSYTYYIYLSVYMLNTEILKENSIGCF